MAKVSPDLIRQKFFLCADNTKNLDQLKLKYQRSAFFLLFVFLNFGVLSILTGLNSLYYKAIEKKYISSPKNFKSSTYKYMFSFSQRRIFFSRLFLLKGYRVEPPF